MKGKKVLSVLWHGKIKEDQIAKAISSYHVLIHPTICMETFGLNIAEALSMEMGTFHPMWRSGNANT